MPNEIDRLSILLTEILGRIIKIETHLSLVKGNKEIENVKLVSANAVIRALNISTNTLQKLRTEKKIPFIKIGGAFRYDLEKIMQAYIQKP